MMTEVKRIKRLHRAVSIPLLQAKLKISHQEARQFIDDLKREVEAKKAKKVSKNSRPS